MEKEYEENKAEDEKNEQEARSYTTVHKPDWNGEPITPSFDGRTYCSFPRSISSFWPADPHFHPFSDARFPSFFLHSSFKHTLIEKLKRTINKLNERIKAERANHETNDSVDVVRANMIRAKEAYFGKMDDIGRVRTSIS